jgi:hypothetical protein
MRLSDAQRRPGEFRLSGFIRDGTSRTTCLPGRSPKYGEGWGSTRAVIDEENTVVETSDYRSAAETRRNPLLQVKAARCLAKSI